MFSPDIVESEEFLTMPISSQALYFHLAMAADDDGFVQPKIIIRTIGANDDDLRVLLSKRFLLTFETGVVVIKHWLIHNMIRADRYKTTRFQKEKSLLTIKENKAYTDNSNTFGCQNVNQPAPQVRLGKDRLGKVSLEREAEKSATPSQEAKLFFNDVDEQERILWNLEAKGFDCTIAKNELAKFISYWSELNKSGSKQRWELERTFEVGRRLATWFSRVKEFSGQSNKGKEIIL